MRLKRDAILKGSSMQASLLLLLRQSTQEMIEDEKRKRRAHFLRNQVPSSRPTSYQDCHMVSVSCKPRPLLIRTSITTCFRPLSQSGAE